METKANYVLIGAFTIGVAIFGLLFSLWAAKYASDRNWEYYAVVFNEPVTGLSVGSSVQYNGIAVGTVQNLQLAPNDPRQVVATLRVDETAPIKVDTRARLSMTSVTSPPIIQLTGGDPDSPRLRDASRRDIPIILTAPSALQNIADTANKLVERLDILISRNNLESLENTLRNIENATAAFSDSRDDIRSLLHNANQAAAQLNGILASTDRVLNELDRGLVQQLPGLVRSLEEGLTSFESAADGADALLNENRAAVNSFANDGLAQLGPTLSELRGLIRDLRGISDRLEANPARYLLGRDAPREFTPE